jgi:hypothetical protein
VKIISGGQTGVDRAALDAAMKHGFECGGWCPAGRLDEFGRIPDRYPLRELGDGNKEGGSPRKGVGPSLRAVGLSEPEAGPEADRPGDRSERERDVFAERTLANVKDSDGTLVIYFGEPRGGTKFTVQCCVEQKRPHKLIDAAEVSAERAAESIADFVREEKVTTLNVAGPRQSEWPDGYDYTFRALDIFFTPWDWDGRCSNRPVGG